MRRKHGCGDLRDDYPLVRRAYYVRTEGLRAQGSERMSTVVQDLSDALRQMVKMAIVERECFHESHTKSDGTYPDPDDEAEVREMDAVIDKARAAIAKAEESE